MADISHQYWPQRSAIRRMKDSSGGGGLRGLSRASAATERPYARSLGPFGHGPGNISSGHCKRLIVLLLNHPPGAPNQEWPNQEWPIQECKNPGIRKIRATEDQGYGRSEIRKIRDREDPGFGRWKKLVAELPGISGLSSSVEFGFRIRDTHQYNGSLARVDGSSSC